MVSFISSYTIYIRVMKNVGLPKVTCLQLTSLYQCQVMGINTNGSMAANHKVVLPPPKQNVMDTLVAIIFIKHGIYRHVLALPCSDIPDGKDNGMPAKKFSHHQKIVLPRMQDDAWRGPGSPSIITVLVWMGSCCDWRRRLE
jgi:hypothetical protein